MTRPGLEESQGKLRVATTTPRDVATVATVRERPDDRDELGRFTSGNGAATGRAAKTAVRRWLDETAGRCEVAGVPADDATAVARDALTMFRGAKRDLAATSVLVLGPLANWATWQAVHGYLMAEAARVGFASPEGLKLAEVAAKAAKVANQCEAAAFGVQRQLAQREERDEGAELRRRQADFQRQLAARQREHAKPIDTTGSDPATENDSESPSGASNDGGDL